MEGSGAWQAAGRAQGRGRRRGIQFPGSKLHQITRESADGKAGRPRQSSEMW